MRFALLISFLATLLTLPSAAQQPCLPGMPCKQGTCKPDTEEPAICFCFDGLFAFESAKGMVKGRVVIKNWQIANGETTEIPHQGFLIVQLRAGALTTEIGYERKEWSEGAFWSVPTNERLIVHTERDSVVLQTIDFITR